MEKTPQPHQSYTGRWSNTLLRMQTRDGHSRNATPDSRERHFKVQTWLLRFKVAFRITYSKSLHIASLSSLEVVSNLISSCFHVSILQLHTGPFLSLVPKCKDCSPVFGLRMPCFFVWTLHSLFISSSAENNSVHNSNFKTDSNI